MREILSTDGDVDPLRPASLNPTSKWGWVAVPLLIALASRAFSIAVLLGLGSIKGSLEPDAFGAWDGNWYLRIARDGYHTVLIGGGYDFAFYPGWPVAIRIASLGSPPSGMIATVLANALFVAAVLMFWRLIAARFQAGVASAATALLAFAPPAYAFSMAYSESLFLLLATASLAMTSPGRRTVFAAMAALSRVTGLALL